MLKTFESIIFSNILLKNKYIKLKSNIFLKEILVSFVYSFFLC